MIKRTIYFSSPTHIFKRHQQLCFSHHRSHEPENEAEVVTIPIEDIGVMVLDNKQITLSQAVLDTLLEHNAAVIICNESHMPSGLFLPLAGNTIQTERFRDQINATEPLKKQLWAQTVSTKIKNQATHLEKRNHSQAAQNLLKWSKEVKSGDTTNLEARAAALYWQTIFSDKINFNRSREGEPPNQLLNYGYAILRAVVGKSLVATGLLPTLGIFHRNKYNAYCLADDIMEPYRPYVDEIVGNMLNKKMDVSLLSKEIKALLLQVPAQEVILEDEKTPITVAAQRTAYSLYRCFTGENRKILYPTM